MQQGLTETALTTLWVVLAIYFLQWHACSCSNNTIHCSVVFFFFLGCQVGFSAFLLSYC